MLVIGGGPAGSTAATLLAERGRKVVMLEKDRHPRFHIGESLLPQNLALFERLGVLDEVARIGVYKPGAEFVADDEGGKSVAFEFANGIDPAFTYSFQVRRSEFDELLFRNAERRGVDAHEGVRVTAVELDAGRGSKVTAVGPDGEPQTWLARFVVDASGRDTLLAGKLGMKAANKHNNTAAMFGALQGRRAAARARGGQHRHPPLRRRAGSGRSRCGRVSPASERSSNAAFFKARGRRERRGVLPAGRSRRNASLARRTAGGRAGSRR